jgi:hypothetical protein
VRLRPLFREFFAGVGQQVACRRSTRCSGTNGILRCGRST